MVDIPASIQPLAGALLAAPVANILANVPANVPVNVPVNVPANVLADVPAGVPVDNARLRAEAERFEAAFLAEMLRYTGLGRMPDSFNGGAGEAAFAGSLVQEYANRIAATGTLGIADRIYDSLAARATK